MDGLLLFYHRKNISICTLLPVLRKFCQKFWEGNFASFRVETHHTPNAVTGTHIVVPPNLLETHKRMTLAANIMFIKKIPFLFLCHRFSNISPRKVLKFAKSLMFLTLFLKSVTYTSTVASRCRSVSLIMMFNVFGMAYLYKHHLSISLILNKAFAQ